MKFIHLADLHIGKRVNGFPMLEDQRYILKEILQIAKDEQADGVLIAGDIYDKPIPSAEAVNLFDDFLVSLIREGIKVYAISGNHDSAERISYAGRILRASGVYISERFNGVITPVRAEDEHGELNIYLFPYIHPSLVRNCWPEDKVTSYSEAMEVLIAHSDVDPDARNLAVVHQFITAAGEEEPERSDSEEKHIGGLDNIDASVFKDFDYVALGHLHGPQRIGRDTIRYAGSPLKYSFSEMNQKKSVTVINFEEKGNVTFRQIPLTAQRDFKAVRGKFEEITSPEFVANLSADDYYKVTLTDEEDIPNAIARLRKRFYENLMLLDYDNTRTNTETEIIAVEGTEEKDPIDVLEDLYQMQNGRGLSDLQKEIASRLIGDIWGGDN